MNTGASAAQALFTLALFPLLCALRGVPLSGMPAYAASAWSALSAAAPVVSAYIAANLAMNVALLRVLRASGAVVSSLISAHWRTGLCASFCLFFSRRLCAQ